MKKLPILAVLATVSLIALAAPYASAQELPQAQISQAEQASVDKIIQEIQAAAESGDEQLVSKLLDSGIKANPKLAGKIVEKFSATFSAPGSKIDASKVINAVIASLGNIPGSEQIVAAILSSYTPAAGGNQRAGGGNLPPALPSTASVASESVSEPNPVSEAQQTGLVQTLPEEGENPNQSSPN